MPLVDFLDGVGEIEGWVHQQVLRYADLPLLSIDRAQISAFKGAQACPEEVDPQNLDAMSRSQDRKGFLHGFVQVTGVFRSVPRRAASTGRQGKVPAHRGGQDDDMRALLIEEAGEISGKPEVRVGANAGENEEQRCGMVL